jgi:putative nucleotidyltransferase with HDIG domain
MISPAILRKLSNIEDLPTLPEVKTMILRTVQDDRSSLKDLTTILERDHSITAHLLRIANSSFYGFSRKISSLRHAVVLLGFDAVEMLAIATSVFSALAHRKQFALDPKDFWMHSLGVAKAAQIVSAKHCPVHTPDVCFTAGLLHDIGKFVLALALKQEYAGVVKSARESERNLADVEKEVLETTHAEVGAWIGKKWRFPDVIVCAIASLYEAGTNADPRESLAAVVSLSDRLSRMAGFGLAGDPPVSPDSPAFGDNPLNVENRIYADIARQLYDLREETLELLSLMTADTAGNTGETVK